MGLDLRTMGRNLVQLDVVGSFLYVRQVTALRAEVERLSKDYETTRVERDKVCASSC